MPRGHFFHDRGLDRSVGVLAVSAGHLLTRDGAGVKRHVHELPGGDVFGHGRLGVGGCMHAVPRRHVFGRDGAADGVYVHALSGGQVFERGWTGESCVVVVPYL